jgi:hypothetical protein
MPQGAEKCILFPCLFMHLLLCQHCVLLARLDLSNLKGLVKQLDELWAHHSSEYLVAAAPGGGACHSGITVRIGSSGTQAARMAPLKKGQ